MTIFDNEFPYKAIFVLEDRLMELGRLAVSQAHIVVIVVLLVGRKIDRLLKFEWLKITDSVVVRLPMLKYDSELMQEFIHVHVSHFCLILEVSDYLQVVHVFYVVIVIQLREACSLMMEVSVGIGNFHQFVVLLVTEV